MRNTGMMTEDGLSVYDLEPQSGELMVVAGPPDFVGAIDPDHLPKGFRWVDDDEWSELSSVSDEPCGMSDVEADADALASAGWGTDEDYGYYGDGGDDF